MAVASGAGVVTLITLIVNGVQEEAISAGSHTSALSAFSERKLAWHYTGDTVVSWACTGSTLFITRGKLLFSWGNSEVSFRKNAGGSVQLSVEITNSACVRWIRKCLNFKSEVAIDESAWACGIGYHAVNSKDLGACRVGEERACHVDISSEEEVRTRWWCKR